MTFPWQISGGGGEAGDRTRVSRLIIALCLLISVAGIMDRDLWTPDEPREAAIALEMSRTGNLIVPHLAGVPFVEKPPLYYIVSSSAIRFLGDFLGNTAALRLTSALWGLGTLGMTFLLARRMMAREMAVVATLILATMPGFLYVTHWLLVDNALVFFVVATFWALIEAYRHQRSGLLLAAALFAAGAFLSKGFIAVLIIGLGWLGLLPLTLGQDKKDWLGGRRGIFLHLAGLLIFVACASAWMAALRVGGGAGLWREWFWNNHFGRFAGGAVQLGHSQAPWYYIAVLPVYVLPWIATVLVGIVRIFRMIYRRQRLEWPWRFLALWGLGGLLLLSLSATKRDIYLSVLLPALAILGALSLDLPGGVKIVRLWSRIWLAALLLGFVAMIIAPLCGFMGALLLGHWGFKQILILAILLVSAALLRETRRSLPHRLLAVTAIFYLTAILVLVPVVDRVKSYGPAFRRIGRSIRATPSARLVGFNLDETTRAGFYYYCDLVFPNDSDIKELRQILEGVHSQYNGAIVLSKTFPPPDVLLPAWRVVSRARMGPKRAVLWIEGRRESETGK